MQSAGCHHDVGPGRPELLHFYLACDSHPEVVHLVHGHGAAAPAAAVIFPAVGCHLDVILDEGLEQFPGLIHDPARAGNVAGVVIRDPLLDDVGRELEFAFLELVVGQFHAVDHGQGLVTPEHGHVILGRAGSVAAFPNQDVLDLQAMGLGQQAGDVPLQYPVAVEQPVDQCRRNSASRWSSCCPHPWRA